MPSGGGRSRVATKRHKPPDRLLVIDESLSPKMASRLRERGREALSTLQLGLREALDPEVLEAVFGEHPEAILVTGDDRMPGEHPVVIANLRATLATVEPWERRPRAPLLEHPELAVEEVWKREVVQRWAHMMAAQDRGSIRRYARDRHVVWVPNIRNPQGKLFK